MGAAYQGIYSSRLLRHIKVIWEALKFEVILRLEILAMRFTALMLRVMVRLGFAPKAETEEVYQFLEM